MPVFFCIKDGKGEVCLHKYGILMRIISLIDSDMSLL